MPQQDVFHFLCADIETAADNDVFCPVKKSDAVIFLDLEQVAGIEISVFVERDGRKIGTLEVTGNDVWPLIVKLSYLAFLGKLFLRNRIDDFQRNVPKLAVFGNP